MDTAPPPPTPANVTATGGNLKKRAHLRKATATVHLQQPHKNRQNKTPAPHTPYKETTEKKRRQLPPAAPPLHPSRTVDSERSSTRRGVR
jgi:hypothetical protein